MELFLAACLVAGTPLLLAILGEIITEKSGSLNLGVEGMMILGSLGAFVTAYTTKNPILTLIVGMIAGGLGALIFAFLTVTLRANQTVTGLALTIFGTGVANFLGKKYVGQIVPENVKQFFAAKKLPILGDIPFLGNIFFNQSIFIYLAVAIVILTGLYVYKTKYGLTLTSIGENPAAADSAGINVNLYKYVHIVYGGALCGLAGASLSIVYVPAWQESLTAGKGWIAVALVIFCKWNPYRVFLGAYIFGGLDILGFRIQHLDIKISQYFIDMLPYLVTIIILVISSVKKDKTFGPKALGNNFFREER